LAVFSDAAHRKRVCNNRDVNDGDSCGDACSSLFRRKMINNEWIKQ